MKNINLIKCSICDVLTISNAQVRVLVNDEETANRIELIITCSHCGSSYTNHYVFQRTVQDEPGNCRVESIACAFP
jgi:RNase P subunit RPR2